MTLGSFHIEVLGEGRFEIFNDGHINRAPENISGTPLDKAGDTSESITAGINPLLVQTGEANILLDTGLGWGLDAGSKYENVSNIKTNLEIFGLETSDITHVILSHLHYDHAAGSSYSDQQAKTLPTFPNATYFVHKKEWEFALEYFDNDYPLFGANYEIDDLLRLVANEQIQFLEEEETQILEGITAIKTGGHTPGHQIVRFESEGEVAYYLADLVPTAFHLNQYAMSSADNNSVEAKKQKTRILRKACQEKAFLFLYHSKSGGTGRLLRDEDQHYVLADLVK